MNHVTDERSDRPLGRDLHDWLERSIEDLPDQDALPPDIRTEIVSRLPGTPQRRRWWPFRWFPFGIGATRSTEVDEPHPEGRPTSMFSATRVAAGVAILALIGSFAYIAVPGGGEPMAPGADTRDIDPADFAGFSGTTSCSAGEAGTVTTSDLRSLTEGETYRCTHVSSDPRISGDGYSVHDSFRFDGVRRAGVRTVRSVITNDAGAWVGEQEWGYQNPRHGAMRYAHLYRGTGDYEGLSALMVLTQDRYGPYFDVEGVIFPGDLPPAPEAPVEATMQMWEQLTTD
jgi:hypothetical protein